MKRRFSPASSATNRPDPVGLAAALATTLAAAVISSVVFGRIPHVQDSIAQLFQARIFAHGRLWAPSPPFREFFDYTHIILGARWYGQYPPGFSLLLVPGVWLGIAWLINPILGGLAVYGVFLLGRELFGTAVGRLAAVLGALSPFLIVMASEFMAHVSGLATLTYFLVFLLRVLQTGRRTDGVVSGACLAWAVLIRPYSALAFAVPAFLFALGHLGTGGITWRRLWWPAAGGLLGVVLLGLYQWGTTGNPLVSGYVALYGPSHGIGFGKGSWGPPHTLARGLRHSGQSLASLNTQLFEWPITSLWPLVLGVIPLARRQAERGGTTVWRWRRLLLISLPLSLLVAYAFYWYHDLCFGPRYLYEGLAGLLVVSALGLRQASGWLSRLFSRGDANRARTSALIALLVILSAAAFALGWPTLFRPPAAAHGAAPGSGERMASYFQYYSRQYWGVSPYLGELVAREIHEPAIVFVRTQEPELDMVQVRYLWFGSAFAWLEPDIRRARIVFARDRGDSNLRLIQSLPDRVVYRYDGTIEAGSLQLMRGPSVR